jgi:hypothetical protein
MWSYGPLCSRKGLRSKKELIGDRELVKAVTLDNGKRKTLNPDRESGITMVKC